jgi:hypothetical protein
MLRRMRSRPMRLHAYISMGVRRACVNEQQTAPARAYLEYSAASPSFVFNALVTDGSGMCSGISAATRDEDGGEAGRLSVL